MNYISDFKSYEINEGFKSWLTTFLIMANLGLVPVSVMAGDKNSKMEYFESQPQSKKDAALLVDFMNKNSIFNLDKAYSVFTQSNQLKSSKEDMSKYINISGKQVLFDKKYQVNDYSNADINKFTPTNWLTDMGDFIPDQDEPEINNWISDYKEKTNIEIGIITVKDLNGVDIADYAQDQFNRLGVGQKYTNDGILIVFSMNDRKSRIQTGYGMEGYLTDIECGHILDRIIKPKFKGGNYEEGIKESLEKIQDILGNEAFELKKQKDQEIQKQKDLEFSLFMSEAGVYLGYAAIIALIVGAIVYTNKKAKKSKKEKEEALEILHELMKNIEYVVGAFPKSINTNSNSLSKLYEETKKVINETNLLVQPIGSVTKKEDIDKLTFANDKLYQIIKEANNKFTSLYNSVKSKQSEIESISSLRSNTYKLIASAAASAIEIEKLGYQSGKVPNKEDLDKLDGIYNQIISVISSDFDKASSLFSTYKTGTDNIATSSSNIATSLSIIRRAIDRIKNWKSEISSIKSKFDRVANSREKSEVDSAISKFTSDVSNSKDYIKLENSLDQIIQLIKKAIRRQEEEEEENRRRRRRQEEEEEESRRRSYSSSSNNDGFGGFGGGMSGGGGASSSW